MTSGDEGAMALRDAGPGDLQGLARLWCDAWHDAHADLAPAPVVAQRTPALFAARLPNLLPETRVIGPTAAPLGFCTTREDEVHQIYVAAAARGSGVAARLMIDAEEKLRRCGLERIWLSCAIGNHRAARFYLKSGWSPAGTMFYDGWNLEVCRYEKLL